MGVDLYGDEGEGNLSEAGGRETYQNTLHKKTVFSVKKIRKERMKGQKYI